MTHRPPEHLHLEIRTPATPEHSNPGGDIFGGWLMAQADIAGSIPAVKRAGGRVVTVAVNRFVFLKPVLVGDIVNVYTDAPVVGRTSMTFAIEIWVERNLRDPVFLKVAEAEIVYVALDEKGRPRAVRG
ncbi:MAG TPA: acyl-CoA thioesterase [Gammaproteobacteria bacterium]|nr:acyl-CoA thioesterase [Gammaproteobacteria bacterium]